MHTGTSPARPIVLDVHSAELFGRVLSSLRSVHVTHTYRFTPRNRNRNHTRDTLAPKRADQTRLVRRTLPVFQSLPLRCPLLVHLHTFHSSCPQVSPTQTPGTPSRPISPPPNDPPSWTHPPTRIAHTGRPQSANGLSSLETHETYTKWSFQILPFC